MSNAQEFMKYQSIVSARCIKKGHQRLNLGERYRLGVRYSPLLCKRIYHVLDITDALGFPIKIEIEDGYFEEEKLKSISFILS